MESIRVSRGRESSRGIGQVSTSNLNEKFQLNYEAFSFTWWIHRISPTVSKVRITLQSPFQSGGLNLKLIVLCQCSSNFWFISVVGYVMTILVCSLICTIFSVFAKGKEVVCLSLVWFGEADTVLYSSRRVRLFVVKRTKANALRFFNVLANVNSYDFWLVWRTETDACGMFGLANEDKRVLVLIS